MDRRFVGGTFKEMLGEDARDKTLSSKFYEIDKFISTLSADKAERFVSSLMSNAYFRLAGKVFTTKRPKWYNLLLKKYEHCLYKELGGLVDHDYFLKNGTWVLEPYGAGDESLNKLIAFCRRERLTVEITGRTVHFPNSTIGVHIRPKR